MSLTFLRVLFCSAVLLAGGGCKSRNFGSKSASSSLPNESAEYEILNTGPNETELRLEFKRFQANSVRKNCFK